MIPEAEPLTMTDRELLEYCAQMLARLEPLMSLIENPPPMMAAMIPGLGTSED